MNTFEKTIKAYLDNVAQSDAVFAQKFYDRCEKEKDAIKDCCSYITSEAKKQAQGGCAVVEDAEVFGWSIHFFDENIQKPKDAPKAKVQVPSIQKKEDAPKEMPKPVKDVKPNKAEAEWPSLFTFNEEDE